MKYPYYIVPDVEEYRKLNPDSEEAVKLSRRIAANIGDYASLRLVLGIDPPEFAKFYPDMEIASPSTMDTIDAFLDKFGNPGAPDPLATPLSSAYKIEEIINENSHPPQNEESVQEKVFQTDPTSECDLKSLIKNKRYSEALQLIESQNLNNPEKSIYFAHQIRFIKKLMALEKFNNSKKARR